MEACIWMALAATLGTWLVTALGAATVVFFSSPKEKTLNLMLGFSAGVMIAASFWSLLEPAIAQAESLVHGVPVDQIHFHEVGTLDALADITAVCYLLEQLSPERIVASPVQVGFGKIRCAHGILPVPAPATAQILLGIPIRAGDIPGELCTPTGAALLRQFVNDFGPMPLMTVERIGYGLGQKDFPAANCLRAMLGES